MSRSLIVLPDDSAKPILDAINGAKKSLRIKMFVFSDPQLLKAVLAARARGVKVQVMLNPARRSGEEDNENTRKILTAGGVDVLDSNPAYDVTHEKSMVVDDNTAFVKSLNWQTKNLTETRDYAVVTSHASRGRRSHRVLRGRLEPQGLSVARDTLISSGAREMAATASPPSSTAPSTRCSSKTNAIRIPSSSSIWCAPRCVE